MISRFQLKGKSRKTLAITVCLQHLCLLNFEFWERGCRAEALLPSLFMCAPEGSDMVKFGRCLSPLIQNPSVSYFKLYRLEFTVYLTSYILLIRNLVSLFARETYVYIEDVSERTARENKKIIENRQSVVWQSNVYFRN